MPRPAGFALIALAPNATAKPTIIAPQRRAESPRSGAEAATH
jgi:hypothetical protein